MRLAAQLTETKIIIVDEGDNEIAGVDENGEIIIAYAREGDNQRPNTHLRNGKESVKEDVKKEENNGNSDDSQEEDTPKENTNDGK